MPITTKQQRLDREKAAKREAANKRRRERAQEKRALAAAAKAAEGETDFAALVEAEQARYDSSPMAAYQRKGGRKAPKQITAARESLIAAFDLMGGVPALVVWGRQNPTEFYRIWARLIPRESMELSAQLPLESLLEKLSGHGNEGMSVSDAAWQVGADLMEEGRKKAAEEDLLQARPEDIN